jgi:hypothetical protein
MSSNSSSYMCRNNEGAVVVPCYPDMENAAVNQPNPDSEISKKKEPKEYAAPVEDPAAGHYGDRVYDLEDDVDYLSDELDVTQDELHETKRALAVSERKAKAADQTACVCAVVAGLSLGTLAGMCLYKLGTVRSRYRKKTYYVQHRYYSQHNYYYEDNVQVTYNVQYDNVEITNNSCGSSPATNCTIDDVCS